MQKYIDAVLTSSGTPAAGASVSVTVTATGLPATIYSDNGATVIAGSTVTADASGEYAFYADNGRYTLTISYAGYVAEVRTDVVLFDPADAIPVSVKDFGAKGDGSADDSAAIQAALAVGGAILFPAGTYKCTTFSIAPAAYTRMVGEGQGKTILRFVSTTTTSKVDLNIINGNFSVEGMTLYHDGIAAETAQILSLRSSNIRISDCEIKSNDSAVVDTVTNAFQFLDEAVNNLEISNCNIHNVNRVILKANTALAAISNVLVSGNYIHDLGEGGVQFNCPTGSASGVQIVNNRFATFYSGSERIFCGGSSLQNAVIDGNVFSGSCLECVHLEENAQNVVISNNTFNADGSGVRLIDNNISGSFYQPQHIVISGNTFNNAGTLGTNSGILSNENGTGLDSSSYVSITGNTFRRYAYGAELGYGTTVATGNIFNDCTVGIKTNDARPTIEGNAFENCTTAVSLLIFTGLIGNNTYTNCTTALNTVATDTTKVSVTGFKISVNSDVTLAASTTTDVPLGISVGAKMYGQAKVVAYISATDFQHRLSTLSYDGATVTDTEVMRVGSGTIAATGFVNSSGTLAFRFTNSSTVKTLRLLVVQFDGMWTSAD